jgi:hypothetical protein
MSTGEREGLTVEQLVEMVKADAIEWSAENGLKGTLRTQLAVTEFGFRVEVDSDTGKSSVCIYQRDGSRSMYEVTKGGQSW